jgi:hypothetical protein
MPGRHGVRGAGWAGGDPAVDVSLRGAGEVTLLSGEPAGEFQGDPDACAHAAVCAGADVAAAGPAAGAAQYVPGGEGAQQAGPAGGLPGEEFLEPAFDADEPFGPCRKHAGVDQHGAQMLPRAAGRGCVEQFVGQRLWRLKQLPELGKTAAAQ